MFSTIIDVLEIIEEDDLSDQKIEVDYFNPGKKTHRKTDGVINPYNFCLLDFIEKKQVKGKGSYILKLCLPDFLKKQVNRGHSSHLKFPKKIFIFQLYNEYITGINKCLTITRIDLIIDRASTFWSDRPSSSIISSTSTTAENIKIKFRIVP